MFHCFLSSLYFSYRTDICIVVVEKNEVLESLTAVKQLESQNRVEQTLNSYGVTDRGVSAIFVT